MKPRNCIRVLVAAGFVFAAASALDAGENPRLRPFWGSTTGELTWTLDSSCPAYPPAGQPLRTVSTTTGQMTHLGRTSLLAFQCTKDGSGARAVFTAANGDQVWATHTAHPVPSQPPLMVQEGEFFLDGGTGRFEHASGHLLVTIYVTRGAMTDPSWPVRFVFVGTIAY